MQPDTGTNEPWRSFFDQTAALQKLWLNSLSSVTRAASSFRPDEPKIAALREVRSGMLKGLAQVWDEFLRSPQFGEMMRRSVDSAMQLRGAANQALTNSRRQFQAPAQEDIDNLLAAMHQLERRVLDELEHVNTRLCALEENGHQRPSLRKRRRSRPRSL